jgi:hypothetical protein
LDAYVTLYFSSLENAGSQKGKGWRIDFYSIIRRLKPTAKDRAPVRVFAKDKASI